MSNEVSGEGNRKAQTDSKRRDPRRSKMRWLPVSAIPHIASEIDGLLAADEKNYQALLKAKVRPGVLDSETVDRLIQAFTEQGRELEPCQEQLLRWRNSVDSDAQRNELNKIGERLHKIQAVISSVLSLATEVKAAAPRSAQRSGSLFIIPFPPVNLLK